MGFDALHKNADDLLEYARKKLCDEVGCEMYPVQGVREIKNRVTENSTQLAGALERVLSLCIKSRIFENDILKISQFPTMKKFNGGHPNSVPSSMEAPFMKIVKLPKSEKVPM